MQKRAKQKRAKQSPAGVPAAATEKGAAQRPPQAERSPGEYRYKNIGHKARIAGIAKGLKLPESRPPLSPAWQRLMDYLKPFWGSPHETEIWDLYRRFTHVDPRDRPGIEAAAAAEGLTAADWIAKSALAEIRRHVRSRPHLVAILTSSKAEAESANGGTLAPPSQEPADLIPCAVAMKEFCVSRATLQRQRKAGTLKGYRLPGAPPNATFRYSRSDLKAHFVSRPPRQM
jgi:hypothetical protein